jgi:hypothetical protein
MIIYKYMGGGLNPQDHIGTSSESLASLIPVERRQELANFEMSLKQMIEEARQLAASPPREMAAPPSAETEEGSPPRELFGGKLGSR